MTAKFNRRPSAIAVCLAQTVALICSAPAFANTKWDSFKKAGDAAYESGNYAEAEKNFAAAVAEAEKFDDVDKRKGTTVYNLALVYQTEEKFDKAEPLYLRAVELLSKEFGDDHEKVAQAYENLAEVRKSQDDIKKAAEYYDKAMTIYEKAYGDKNPQMAGALDTVADFYADEEEYAKAEPLFERAIGISRATVGTDKWETGKRLAHLGEVYAVQGKSAKAEPLFLEALDISKKANGANSPDTGKCMYNLGGLYYDLGNFAKAEPYFKQAIAIAEHNTPKDAPMMMVSLGDVLDMQGKHPEADKIYKDALSRLEKGEDQQALLACLKNYQKHLNMQNSKDEAKKIGERIKELKAKLTPTG